MIRSLVSLRRERHVNVHNRNGPGRNPFCEVPEGEIYSRLQTILQDLNFYIDCQIPSPMLQLTSSLGDYYFSNHFVIIMTNEDTGKRRQRCNKPNIRRDLRLGQRCKSKSFWLHFILLEINEALLKKRDTYLTIKMCTTSLHPRNEFDNFSVLAEIVRSVQRF